MKSVVLSRAGWVGLLVVAAAGVTACEQVKTFDWRRPFAAVQTDAGAPSVAPGGADAGPAEAHYLLRPARVWDGTQDEAKEGWVVLVHGSRIALVGAENDVAVPPGTEVVELPGTTVLPGLMEAHAHLLLHPYNETKWGDQVLTEALALRVARATVSAQHTLLAGFTLVRDLGTEGAGYADVGLKQAIEQGIVPGPHMLVATRAIVATGSYGPQGFAPEVTVPLGAEEADGVEALTRVVRSQIGHGADWIKVYADARWRPGEEARPSFTQDELTRVVEIAKAAGRPVAAHATTREGMRRAILAGVETIEHGDEGSAEIFRLMKERGVALCPTLSVAEAMASYRGYRKGIDPEPNEVAQKRASFRDALAEGVTIAAGSDVGVFAHGDEARELETMAAWGMPAPAVLKAATVVNARVLHVDDHLGTLRAGYGADMVVVDGDPSRDVRLLRQVRMVVKNGVRYAKR